VENSDREKAKAQATRSNATTIVGSDKVAGMIGQALSAITLGFTARNGGKIAISELARRRHDSQRVVKERIRERKRSIFRRRRAPERRCGRRQHTAITLGFTAGNGEKIAVFGLLRRRPDGRRVVQERFSGVKSGFLQPPKGSRDALRTADNTPRSLSH
jgi:hypothetical protein